MRSLIIYISETFSESVQFSIVDQNGVDGGTSGLLLYNGGTVCDNGFDSNAANAICSHLGYSFNGSIWTSEYKWGVQTEYAITLDEVICTTHSWSSCLYSQSHDCFHGEDVFLTCFSGEEGTVSTY